VLPVQKRLTERVGRLRSRLCKTKTLRGGQCYRSRMTLRRVIHGTSDSNKSNRPQTWCCRSRSVLLRGSVACAPGSVRRRRFAVVNATGHGWL